MTITLTAKVQWHYVCMVYLWNILAIFVTAILYVKLTTGSTTIAIFETKSIQALPT